MEDQREVFSNAQQSSKSKHYEITVVRNATIPENPVSPNKKLNIAIAGILGLMLSIFLVFFIEFMKEEEDKEIVVSQ